MTAPDNKKSGAIKSSALQKLSSLLVAKQRFIGQGIKLKKNRKNANLMPVEAEQHLECQNKLNKVIIHCIRANFAKHILCS